MPKYVIEREMPGIGQLSAAELQLVSDNSRVVLKEMGPEIQWIESYVTNDKMYSIFIAPNEDILRQHALQAGFPINKISIVSTLIHPTPDEEGNPI
jgi:hypothetical protein